MGDVVHSWDQLFSRLPEEFLINYFNAFGIVTYYRPSPRLPFPFQVGMNIHESMFAHTVAKKAWENRQWYIAYGDEKAFGFPYFAVAFSIFNDDHEFQGVLTFAFPMDFVDEIQSLHQDKSILQWILRLAESTLFIEHQEPLWGQFRDVFLQLFSYRGGVLFAVEDGEVKMLEWFGEVDLIPNLKTRLEQDSLVQGHSKEQESLELYSLIWDRFELDQWGEREVLYLARDPHSSRHPLLGALLDFYRVTRQVVWQREQWRRLHEELDQSQRFYAALAEINAMVYAAGEEESLLDQTCRIIHNYTKVNGCWAYQMKDNQIKLVSVVMDHTEQENEFRVLFSKLYNVDRMGQDELLLQIMKDQQTITINNCNRHRLFQSSERLAFLHKIAANAICTMPIIKEDHVDTILMMIGPSGFFTKSINEVIEAMAKHVSIKLQSMALESKTKVYHDMIEHMAYHDRLTGLKNRAYLEEWLDHLLVIAKNQETTLGLFVVDLDHFKPVNDQFGHQAGDAVLIEVARRMQEVIPSGESIRLGGDEFVIFVPHVNHSTSMSQMAELLIKRIQEPIAFEGFTLSVGASIGMAFAKEIGINPRVLLKAADQALYKVKQSGRNAASF